MARFEETISGSSQNTSRAVVRIGAGATAAKRAALSLPLNWTADDEGRKLLNERLRQIEYELGRPKDYELSVPIHYAHADWDDKLGGPTVENTYKPVAGAKLMLDKIGTWLLLMEMGWMSWTPGYQISAYLAVDPGTEVAAKVQAAQVYGVTSNMMLQTLTAFALFTATSIPRLVQIYAKESGGGEPGNTMIFPPTHVAAIWMSAWTASTRRFGRQTASLTTSILDPYGDPVTIYGEEARWPESEDPDNLPIGADFVTL